MAALVPELPDCLPYACLRYRSGRHPTAHDLSECVVSKTIKGGLHAKKHLLKKELFQQCNENPAINIPVLCTLHVPGVR